MDRVYEDSFIRLLLRPNDSPTFEKGLTNKVRLNIDNVVQGWLTNYPVIHPNDI